LCDAKKFNGVRQFSKMLTIVPMDYSSEGILDEVGDVVGCETRIPFKCRDSKRVVILYGIDLSGQPVDRRDVVNNTVLWEYICDVMGLSRTWRVDEIGFMKKPLKSVTFNDSIFTSSIAYCDDYTDSFEFDNSQIEIENNEVLEEDCQSHVIDNTVAVFSDDEDGDVDDLSSRFADLLEGHDRIPGVNYVGVKSDVVPDQYCFIEAENHRRPVNYMDVGAPEASAILSSKDCLKSDNIYVEIDGDIDNDDINANEFSELVFENDVNEKLDSELSEIEYANNLHHRRENLIRTLIKSLEIFSNNSGRNDFAIVTEERIREICQAAYIYGDTKFGVEEAKKWAEGFTIPDEVVEHDELEFQEAGWDFDQMIENRLAKLRGNRLNVQRIEGTMSRDNPEWELLMELATVGMDLCLPDDYEANNKCLPNLTQSYKNAHSAVDKMIIDNFYKKGLAMIFKLDSIEKFLPAFSLAVARWTEKKNKECGRNIHDASFMRKLQKYCLNSKYSAKTCKEKYGEIHNPTIQDIVLMVFAFWERERKLDPNVKWEDLRIWKMDLAGAFTLLNFKTDCVKHVGLQLWGGLVVFFLCGVFGWTGTPGCFQVVNRALMFEATKLLLGLAQMFCDDVMGVCWAKDVDHEVGAMRKLIISLMGDGSVADHKTEWGVAVVILGYVVDLQRGFVSIASHNLLKALYGFLEINVEELVTFGQVETLASWGSRYGLVCVHMNPLVRVLYRELKQRQRNHRWNLSPACKAAIWFFRALFILTHVDSVGYCRPLWSLRAVDKYLWIAEFDSCLSGIGCIWYSVTPEGLAKPVGAGSWSIESMGFGSDASYQNTAEFMGAILALVGVIRYKAQDKAFLLRGDSKSALSWANKKRIRGSLAVPASFLFNYIWVYYRVMLAKCEHLAAELNIACDGLSREEFLNNVKKFRKAAKLDSLKPRSQRKYMYNYSKVGDRSKCNEIELLKSICDPSQVFESEVEFGMFWKRMVKWCTLVLGKPPKPWTPVDFESELAVPIPSNM